MVLMVVLLTDINLNKIHIAVQEKIISYLICNQCIVSVDTFKLGYYGIFGFGELTIYFCVRIKPLLM